MIEVSEYEPAHYCGSVVVDASNPEEDCVECGEIVGDPPDMSKHADHCPFTTGLWVMEDVVQVFTCSNCDKEHHTQYVCPRCNRFFEEGDPYRNIDDATGLVVPWVADPGSGTAICLDCANLQTEALHERMEAL